jgi:hypothetical protein
VAEMSKQRVDEISILETRTIVDHLSRGRSEKDLILALCEKHDIRWEEAGDLVEQVKEQHADQIALRLMPIKSILAVFIGVGGSALFLVMLLLLIDQLILVHQIVSFEGLDARELILLGSAGPDLISFFLQQTTNTIPVTVVLMIQGLAMLFGSIIGLREAWVYLIDRVAKALWK